MPSRIRRPKTADPSRFTKFRHRYPASTMEVEVVHDLTMNNGQSYTRPYTGRSRSSAACQTDFDPEYSQRLPNEKSTMTTYAVPRPMTEYGYRPGSPEMRAPSVPDYQSFYQRMASNLAQQKPNLNNRFYQEPGPPVFRSGRLGAPWRHIRQCTGNLGNHICFVDARPTEDNTHNQARGRLGPSQNLTQTQGNTGSNLLFVNSQSNAIAPKESPIQSGSFRGGNRTGRLGPYEHVVQVTGNLGNNIAFINPGPKVDRAATAGVVKHGDMQQFPPYGSVDTQLDALAMVSPRRDYERVAHPMMKSARYTDYTPRASDVNRYKTTYNNRAKKGFKYWHDEVPYQGLPAKQTISGALMAKGIGC